MMKKTYEIVTPPEPAMKWEDYSEIIAQEYSNLLERDDVSENGFQKFFENHPCFLPWPYGHFSRGGHGPYPGAVVSQPRLPGLTHKIPDFLCITRDSATVYAVLIEIEHPDKPWATKAGQSSEQFTQACNQIAEWKQWFNKPANIVTFQNDYRIPQDWIRSRRFEQKYILIYGRRSDPSLTEDFKGRRASLQRTDEIHMTFDRLRPEYMMGDCLCVKLDGVGYRAISVPATFEIGPNMEAGVNAIRDKEDAIVNNKLISEVRKKFLVERLPYWDNWSGSGVRVSTDRE